MELRDLFESEATDAAARQEAVNAHRAITLWLKITGDRLSEILIQHPQYPGSYIFEARRAGVPFDDLYIILTPNRKKIGSGYEATASFGTTKNGSCIIFMPVLIAPHDLKHVDTRFGWRKKEFVHEFMHFLMRKRERAARSGSDRSASADNMVDYFNNDDETNAYFQEAAQDILDVVRGLINAGKPAHGILSSMLSKSMSELMQYMKQKFFDKDFIKFASDKTMRALNKRLSRFLSYTVLPQIRDALSKS